MLNLLRASNRARSELIPQGKRMKQLISAVKSQKPKDSQTQFVIDANCVLEALLTALDLEQIKVAILDHGLKGPSYLSVARSLRKEAISRKNNPRT